MIVTIKNAEVTTGDYGEYVKVTGVDGTGKEVSKNVSEKFRGKWGLLVDGATLEFKMVESKDNKWQITDILPVGDQLPAPVKTPQTPLPKETQAQINEDVPLPPSHKSDGKNRSFALAYAKDWCIAQVQGGKDLKVMDVITVATVFESYLENGAQVTKAKKPEPKEKDISDENIPF